MFQAFKKISSIYLAAFIAVVFVHGGVALSQDQPWVEMFQPQGLNFAGIYKLRQREPALDGSDVKFAVICRSFTYLNDEPQNDYRPDIMHNCFWNSRIAFHDSNELISGISPHSTALCSLLFGEDPNGYNKRLGYFSYEGAVPQAQADIYEFWYFLVNNVFANEPVDSDILVAGIGSSREDWWTRGIESMVERDGIIAIMGIGNGSAVEDTPLYPGAGANVIGVGVVDSVKAFELETSLSRFSLVYPEHSSFGPTTDGRCKPDIVAPGNCLAADTNEPGSYQPTGNWSSFSTPIVAGTLGMLVQQAKDDPNLSSALDPNGGNCVMKAILMNSATKLAFWHKGKLTKDDDHVVPLDYLQGAGMLNAVSAYDQLMAGQSGPGVVPSTAWDLNQLLDSKNVEHSYRITLNNPADKVIAVTMVWNKHYKDEYPFEPMPEKDTNLRLELWAIDADNPDNDSLLDYSDSAVDNVEHIFSLLDANISNYEIVVSYGNAVEANDVASSPYAIAWSIKKSLNNYPDRTFDMSMFWYDLNSDGIVDGLDFVILAENLIADAKSPESPFIGDIDASGSIDVRDLQILLETRGLEAEWYK